MVYGIAWGFGGTMQWLFYYAVRILKALIWPSLKVVVSKLWQIQGTRFCVVKRIMINSWEKQNCSGLEFEYGLSGLMWNIGFYLRHWWHHKDQRGSCLRENSLTFLRIRHFSIWWNKISPNCKMKMEPDLPRPFLGSGSSTFLWRLASK